VKRWLSEPVTRAEAIGWGLFLPTAGFAWVVRSGIVGGMRDLEFSARRWPDSVPGSMKLWLSVGPTGVTIACVLCGLLPLGALVTTQRPWVRVAAPIICLALLASMQGQYLSSLREMGELFKLLHGNDAAATLPK
jgi:hypothetical protein